MFGLSATLSAYKNAALGLLFVVLVALLGVQTVRLDRAELKTQAATAEAAKLGADIEAQNAGIAAVKAQAAAQQEAAQKAAKAAQKRLALAEAKAARIEAAPTPKTCPDAIQFLVDDAKGAQ